MCATFLAALRTFFEGWAYPLQEEVKAARRQVLLNWGKKKIGTSAGELQHVIHATIADPISRGAPRDGYV